MSVRSALIGASVLALIAFAVAVGVLVYLGGRVTALEHDIAALSARQIASSTAQSEELALLERALTETESRNVSLEEALGAERQRLEDVQKTVGGFKKEVRKISGSVDTLEKLQNTDPELLQKYSKVYFLNENYMPADLTTIAEEFDFKNGREVSIHRDVWPFLEELLEASKKAGLDLWVLSGYRSFDEQRSLKGTYTVTYGAGSANTFSADQGYSEHQLGTAVDFTTTSVGASLVGFDATPEFLWLQENAHRYGFTLSYPQGNQHYVYEPWHWRFVGVELASDLAQDGKSLYDLDQRKIDEYLVGLFDD